MLKRLETVFWYGALLLGLAVFWSGLKVWAKWLGQVLG